MTLPEFKAWFDGFTESMPGTPTKAQWARIKARVKEIDGVAVTERIFVDRYWPHYWPYSPYYSPTYIHGPLYYSSPNNNPVHYSNNSNIGATSGGSFNSCNAMQALGQAEVLALT